MTIMRIGPGVGNQVQGLKPAETESWNTFGDLMKGALEKAKALEKEADLQAVRLVAGEVEDLHEVTLASEKARIAMELAIQVRNKAIEAYQEIMRIQV